MQRRHFELIARSLLNSRPDASVDGSAYAQWCRTVGTFASELKSTNAKFDRARFLRACGLEG